MVRRCRCNWDGCISRWLYIMIYYNEIRYDKYDNVWYNDMIVYEHMQQLYAPQVT